MNRPRRPLPRPRWRLGEHRRIELRAIGQRAREVGLLAVLTGALTGLGVAAFDRVVNDGLFEHLLDGPLWLQAVGPALGLAVAAGALRWVAAGATPATADEYIKDFHDPDHDLDVRPAPGRLLASAATLGSGAAMGFEGPSIYLGAVIGSWLQSRFSRFFTRADTKVLLACGAAAGVAAIFKAPATGVVFALEVPYRQDLARRMLLPAMFSAATSYVVFAAINGTSPLFPIAGAPPFDLRDLGGAALVGLGAGALARLFAAGLRAAKHAAVTYPDAARVPAAGAALVVVFILGRLVTGESLTIGSGYQAIAWSLEPGHAISAIVAVFALRAAATTIAVGAGGVGGLFIPLVVQGALLGAAVGAAVGASDASLFPVLGVAAFLGAGYRVPLAAVVFVAESTGRPGFVVPGLIAAASSQLLMGAASVSAYQQDARVGRLQRRLRRPVTAALRTDVVPVPADTTIAALIDQHTRGTAADVTPVVEHTSYQGVIVFADITHLAPELWATTTVATLMRRDWPRGDLTWTLAQAAQTMERANISQLPILDEGKLIGMVTAQDILKLDLILDATDE